MAENKHTISDLYQMQALPLSAKIRMTERRIIDWIDCYGDDGVYVSFSGGKDSTVLMDIVRNRLGYKNVPAVFVDVPTQYPELKQFALTWDNVEVLRPKISFMEVCEKHGFPLISKNVSQGIYDVRHQGELRNVSAREAKLYKRCFDKNSEYCKKYPSFCLAKWDFLFDAPFNISHKCCYIMKKKPCKDYEKETGRKPIIGTMASESRLRTTDWLKSGCNAFDLERPTSKPMSFWTEQDVLLYIKQNNLPICSVYGDIVEDTAGTNEVEGQLTISDLEGYEDAVMFDAKRLTLKTTGCQRTGCMLCGFGCHIKQEENQFERLKKTHPKMYALLDVCKSNGVTMREAIDWINENGNMNIKY